MKNNLPPFIEIYRALIATPSISATEEALDQSNESLINLLAGWFRDIGFNVEVQPVPDTRNKFNLLASTENAARAACCLPGTPIPSRLMMVTGLAILLP